METGIHPLSAFPDIPFEYSEILRSRGIITTMDLQEQVKSEEDIGALSGATGIPAYRIGELIELGRLCSEEGLEPAEARKQYDRRL